MKGLQILIPAVVLVTIAEVNGAPNPGDVYSFMPHHPFASFQKRSGDELFLDEAEAICAGNNLNEVVPRIINMKRMMLQESDNNRNKRDGNVALPQWRVMEWARQLHDIERYLAFCNRRNNVSKIRLL